MLSGFWRELAFDLTFAAILGGLAWWLYGKPDNSAFGFYAFGIAILAEINALKLKYKKGISNG